MTTPDGNSRLDVLATYVTVLGDQSNSNDSSDYELCHASASECDSRDSSSSSDERVKYTLQKRYEMSKAVDKARRNKKSQIPKADEKKQKEEAEQLEELKRLEERLEGETEFARTHGDWKNIYVATKLPEAVTENWASDWHVGGMYLYIFRQRIAYKEPWYMHFHRKAKFLRAGTITNPNLKRYTYGLKYKKCRS